MKIPKPALRSPRVSPANAKRIRRLAEGSVYVAAGLLASGVLAATVVAAILALGRP